MRRLVLPLVLALVLVACGEAPPADQAAPPDTMTPAAQAAFDPTVFDTITWENDQAALDRGQVVYNYSCAKCHGPRGLGDADFVSGVDTLRPPSFREPDWIYAGNREAIREQVFVGTAKGMPHWGLEGLKPKDVDAVALYIMQGLGS